MVHLDCYKVFTVVHWPRPTHDLLDDGHDDQVEQEGHEQIEESAKLRGESGLRSQERCGRPRDKEVAIARELQGSQEYSEEDSQAMFMHLRQELPVKRHNMV